MTGCSESRWIKPGTSGSPDTLYPRISPSHRTRRNRPTRETTAAGTATSWWSDAFVTEIGASHTIVFSTFLGGSSADWAGGVAADGLGGIIIAGSTTSADFPVSPGAYQHKYGGTDILAAPAGDAIIARFGGSTVSAPTPSISQVANCGQLCRGGGGAGRSGVHRGLFDRADNLGWRRARLQRESNGSLVAGTQFLFDGVPGPIVYVSSTQSVVLVPYEVAEAGITTQLVAVYNGAKSPAVAVPVTASLPGIFSAQASGTGPAAVINSDGSFNSATNPAARGSSVAFFVTGEGQTTPAGIDGSVTASVIPPARQVSVSIGGVSTTNFQVLGEGPGEVAGVLQINVTIPSNAVTERALCP